MLIYFLAKYFVHLTRGIILVVFNGNHYLLSLTLIQFVNSYLLTFCLFYSFPSIRFGQKFITWQELKLNILPDTTGKVSANYNVPFQMKTKLLSNLALDRNSLPGEIMALEEPKIFSRDWTHLVLIRLWPTVFAVCLM